MRRATRRLTLRAETVRVLRTVDLDQVIGGATPIETSQCPSRQAGCTATCMTDCNQVTCIPWPDPP